MRKSLFFFLFLVTSLSGLAQNRLSTRLTNYWTDFNPIYKINPKLYLRGDLAFRWNEEFNRQLYVIRPVIGWYPNATISYRFGASLFYNNEFYVEDDAELRLHQAAIIRWPKLVGWDLSHRIMLEQRWIYESLVDRSDFLMRLRYRFRVVTPDFSIFGFSKFYIPVSVELLGNLFATDIIAASYQDRFTFGFGNRTSKHIRIELHYQSHGSRLNFGDGFNVDEDVWRIRLYYLINPDKE